MGEQAEIPPNAMKWGYRVMFMLGVALLGLGLYLTRSDWPGFVIGGILGGGGGMMGISATMLRRMATSRR
jgi:hypothetical protein